LTDVVIVGAGAAGISAGRVLASFGVPFVILEASARIGGRAFTDHASLPGQWDQGAQWFHSADVNPLVPLADALGWKVEAPDPAPWSMTYRHGKRLEKAEDLACEATLEAAFQAAYTAAAQGRDVPVSQSLPQGRFRGQVETIFQLMISEDADRTSALGYGDYADSGVNRVVTGGYGALVSRLAQGLPIRTDVAVTAVEAPGRNGVRVQTTAGALQARAVIITASTNVLLSGAIAFGSGPAQGVLDLMQDLPCGSFEKVALAFDRLPFDPEGRRFVFLSGAEGSPVPVFQIVTGPQPKLIAHFGGSAARQMLMRGAAGMIEFAKDELALAFGAGAVRAITGAAVTGWQADPWVQGAYSYARTGGGGARRAMIAAQSGAVRFAGEAFSATAHTTVHGAWQSGQEVAGEIATALLAGKTP
jgi:monoamine oxidase